MKYTIEHDIHKELLYKYKDHMNPHVAASFALQDILNISKTIDQKFKKDFLIEELQDLIKSNQKRS